jgi:hypothetical protein
LFRRNDTIPSPKIASVAVWAGIGLLTLSVLFIESGDYFPGWLATFPALGTASILASIEPAHGQLIPVILAHPLSVFIGKRSYSLYLWHWPVFSFVDYHFFTSDALFRSIFKIILCIVATLLTYHFVERPFRSYLNYRQHRALAFGGFAFAVLAVCGVGIAIRTSNYLSVDPRDIAAGGILVKGGEHGTVALIGDSQGAMYGVELASLARVHRFTLWVLSMAAGNELPQELESHWPSINRFLAERRPDVVIVAEAWSSKLGSNATHLQEALAAIEEFGSRVVLITQPPILPRDGTRETIRAGAPPPSPRHLKTVKIVCARMPV